MRAYLAEAWPILAALGFLLVLTIGALRPYLKRERAKMAAENSPDKEQTDVRRKTDD